MSKRFSSFRISSEPHPRTEDASKSASLRFRTLLSGGLALAALLILIGSGLLLDPERLLTAPDNRNLPPSWTYWFGTDWLGRDMLARTMKGLTLSIGIGMAAAMLSALVALALGLLAGTMGKQVDAAISWLIDLFLGVPHLVALILISFSLGGGAKGVLIGIALTHWPSLARLIRAEVLQLRSSEYVHISRRLGRGRWWIATRHFMPHLLPQLFVGAMLLFPHAILHEAALSFLGLGLPPHEPAIGIILSESMRYMSAGLWWLAFFPGLALLITVGLVDWLSRNVRRWLQPSAALPYMNKR
ncbi:ABC transporter permease [Paenibacillus senegalensis]|uniref:ABC transporter permease n=1 Tax=Paenibacillus senegalensis TaxID=1465766 RepID=UPI0002882689|nr:ABC transporter permease subunit [Paenibacillus senegalensis]